MTALPTLRRLLLLRAPTLPVTCRHGRLIHSTPAVLKKDKKKASSPQTFFDNQEDDFIVEDSGEELFGSKASSSSQMPRRNPTHNTEQFDSLLTSTLQHFAKSGKKGNPPRRTVVKQLCAMASTEEQLEKILDLIAVMRDNKMPTQSRDFFTRCLNLNHPNLVLRALQNRPKYGLDIDSLEHARTILNALAQPQRPKGDIDSVVTNCLAFAELYPLYGLTPASKDLVSSVILAEVLAYHAKKVCKPGETHDALSEILNEVKAMVDPWDPRSLTAKREAQWLMRSSNFIMSSAFKPKDAHPWLLDFDKRIKNGVSI